MQRFLSPLLKRSIVLSTLAAIGCIVLFVTLGLVQSASTQVTKRSFENKIPSHVPLKIKIKKEKEAKVLDINNKHWFRDIEIEVTNTSDKPIYFLSLNVELADLAPDRPNALRTFFLGYGRGEFYEQNTKPIPEDIPIEPKATHTFVITEDQRNGFEKWRSQNNGRDAFKLQMSINHLSYGDGTGFTTLGALPFPFKNSPEELGRCLPKSRPPNEWAKSPTIFSALLAQNLVEPVTLLPVNFFLANDASRESLSSAGLPDICCPGTPCNKLKLGQYGCVCASNAPDAKTSACTDPQGTCGTVIDLGNFCTLNGIGCPSYSILPCGTSLPTPTPTPTPEFTCPSTDPINCESGIAKDPCRDPIGDGCPPFMHAEGACCVRDPCFYPAMTCPAGEVLMRFPAPFCSQLCVQVPGLPQPTCEAFSFIWGGAAQFCRDTVPTSQTDCDNFSWFWNPISDFCQEDEPPPCGLEPSVCDPGSWSFQWCDCVPYSSPILIDVAGNGFNLTNSARGVDFNLNNKGGREKLGWTRSDSDDAWLVLDRNRNGTIDDGTELFGDVSAQPEPPQGVEKNGFRALAEFDKAANGGNADAKIDRNDSVFSRLRFWQDRNHNGVSEAEELHTLPSLNVAVFELDYKESKKTDSNGNQFKYRAKIRNGKGQQLGRWAWDVYLVKGL